MTKVSNIPDAEPDFSFIYENGKVQVLSKAYQDADDPGNVHINIPPPGLDETIARAVEKELGPVKKVEGAAYYEGGGVGLYFNEVTETEDGA